MENKTHSTFKSESILIREALIILTVLVLFLISTFLIDDHIIFEKMHYVLLYGYPAYFLLRVLIFILCPILKLLKIIGARFIKYSAKLHLQKSTKKSREKLLTRESIILLLCLLAFFLSAIYLDDHIIFKRLYSLTFYGYPAYFILRILYYLTIKLISFSVYLSNAFKKQP